MYVWIPPQSMTLLLIVCNRAADVCHYTHPVLICFWDEATQFPSRPGHRHYLRPLLYSPLPLSVWHLYLPGGRLHRSDWLHGLEGHCRCAADQRSVDMDQVVGLLGSRSLYGVGPHHCCQQILLPCAALACHHHGYILCGADADRPFSRGVPGCWRGQEEGVRSLKPAEGSGFTRSGPFPLIHSS